MKISMIASAFAAAALVTVSVASFATPTVAAATYDSGKKATKVTHVTKHGKAHKGGKKTKVVTGGYN
jgi:hypothetical protein